MSKSSGQRKSKASSKATSKHTATKRNDSTFAKAAPDSIPTQAVKISSVSVLQRWNIWVGIVFIVNAAAILLLGKTQSVAVTANYVTIDPLANGHVLVPATRRLFDLNMVHIVCLMLLVAGLAHLAMASIYRKFYENELAERTNRLRWVETAITSSLTFIGVGLLAGIRDLPSLFMIAALAVILHSIVGVIEAQARDKNIAHWTLAPVALVAGIAPLIVLGIYTVATSIYGMTHLPGYVYGLLITLAVSLGVLTCNFVMQQKRQGHWEDYTFGERTYMIISLVAKLVLAWQIYAGLLHA